MKKIIVSWVCRILRSYIKFSPFDKGKVHIVRFFHKKLINDAPVFTRKIPQEITMILDLNSYIERQIYYFGFYRPWVLPFFEKMLFVNNNVIDVGANVGPYTLVAANKVGPGGSVIAFEPDPLCYRKLVNNVELNSFSWVTTENLALNDTEDQVSFYTRRSCEDNQGQGSLVNYDFHSDELLIRSTTLDNYLLMEPINSVDVIKIDTQGSEMKVLRGARTIIDKYRPNVLLRCHEEKVNMQNDSTVDIQLFFKKQGYKLFTVNQSEKKPFIVETIKPVIDATFLFITS